VNYAYEAHDGTIHWITQSLSDGPPPKQIMVDGQVAKRSYAAEQAGVPATKGWPIECYASGVHADQADELRQHLRERGVPTEVTADGDPIYTSAAHRRKALKARGFFDRKAYY
jgi:hypothetical protein